jgi:hypothetical protein
MNSALELSKVTLVTRIFIRASQGKIDCSVKTYAQEADIAINRGSFSVFTEGISLCQKLKTMSPIGCKAIVSIIDLNVQYMLITKRLSRILCRRIVMANTHKRAREDVLQYKILLHQSILCSRFV